jgi:hypothetical protein
VSFFSEAFERGGRWFRSVNLDFELSPKHPNGGAFVYLQFDIPAEEDDPRFSGVFQRAHALAREHLRRALALSERKISEDAFKDEISRASHRAAHALLTRAIELAQEGEGIREPPAAEPPEGR